MNKKTVFPALTIAFLSGLFGTMVMAQEMSVDGDIGVGTRALGMGGAHIGAANDLSALVYNPAALARIKELEIQFGLAMLNRTMDTNLSSSRGRGSDSASSDYSGLSTLGIAYPVPTERGSLVFGFAYNRVKDFNASFEVDGYNDALAGYQTGVTHEEGGMGLLSFGGAVDVSPNVSIGASLDIWLGDYKRDGRSLLNDYDEDYSQLDLRGSDDEISAWSFKPAVLYFKDGFRLGAYARLPMTYKIDESYYSEGYSRSDGLFFNLHDFIRPSSDFNDPEVTYTDKLEYKIKAPMQFGFGAMWGEPGRSLAFDCVYENWTQAKLKYPSSYYPEPDYFRDKYRKSLSWRVGGEHRLPFLDVTGRIGYLRQPLMFKGPRGNDYTEPTISVENQRDYLTLGVGKQFDRSLSVDAAYLHGFWSQKEGEREDEESHRRFFVSITYHTPVLSDSASFPSFRRQFMVKDTVVICR